MPDTRIHPMGAARDHFFLTLGMAKACGADLSEALADGRITQEEYASIMTACRTCKKPGACSKLLATFDELIAAPDYCVNRDKLAEIAAE